MMENQVEKNMENDMEAGFRVVYTDIGGFPKLGCRLKGAKGIYRAV